MTELLFSIIIPCYNQAHYLPECLQSVLSQTYPNWQAIIVNDGSPDNTRQVAREWIDKDARIAYVEKTNGGLSSARNAGINAANGTFIAFLDADDAYHPQYLNEISGALNPASDIIFCGYQYFNETGTIDFSNELQTAPHFKKILEGNLLPPVSVTIRKQLLQSVGQFDETLKSAEDWDMWIRYYKAGAKLQVVPKVLTKYRVVDNSMSRNAARMYDALKTVALRAVCKDQRLPMDAPGNRNYPEVDPIPGIQQSLAMCIGVAVMQGKIEEATALFKAETEAFKLKWEPVSFEPMCSYLSFRYRYSAVETKWVIKEMLPVFRQFFEALSLEPVLSKSALRLIFRRHKMMYNTQQFGMLGRILNNLNLL